MSALLLFSLLLVPSEIPSIVTFNVLWRAEVGTSDRILTAFGQLSD
jgi:hypothetical protein